MPGNDVQHAYIYEIWAIWERGGEGMGNKNGDLFTENAQNLVFDFLSSYWPVI